MSLINQWHCAVSPVQMFRQRTSFCLSACVLPRPTWRRTQRHDALPTECDISYGTSLYLKHGASVCSSAVRTLRLHLFHIPHLIGTPFSWQSKSFQVLRMKSTRESHEADVNLVHWVIFDPDRFFMLDYPQTYHFWNDKMIKFTL